jgi:hypothetical protein
MGAAALPGNTPLHCAAQWWRADAATQLLAAATASSADDIAVATNGAGLSALHLACSGAAPPDVAATGESKRLVIESLWSQFSSTCQRF